MEVLHILELLDDCQVGLDQFVTGKEDKDLVDVMAKNVNTTKLLD